jgi:hypothetical protein
MAGYPMTSKYDRLGDHLAAIGGATITLTFAEVEAVIGPLTKHARESAEWWGATGGGRYHNAHVLHWRRLGYVADRPAFAAGTVTFRRLAP